MRTEPQRIPIGELVVRALRAGAEIAFRDITTDGVTISIVHPAAKVRYAKVARWEEFEHGSWHNFDRNSESQSVEPSVGMLASLGIGQFGWVFCGRHEVGMDFDAASRRYVCCICTKEGA